MPSINDVYAKCDAKTYNRVENVCAVLLKKGPAAKYLIKFENKTRRTRRRRGKFQEKEEIETEKRVNPKTMQNFS